MSFVIFVVAATMSFAEDKRSAALACNLGRPAGTPFEVVGSFTKDRLNVESSALAENKRPFLGATESLVVTSDGTESLRWILDSAAIGEKVDASLTRYGSEVALLVLERRKFIGRHWGRSLIGAGLCKVRSTEVGN